MFKKQIKSFYILCWITEKFCKMKSFTVRSSAIRLYCEENVHYQIFIVFVSILSILKPCIVHYNHFLMILITILPPMLLLLKLDILNTFIVFMHCNNEIKLILFGGINCHKMSQCNLKIVYINAQYIFKVLKWHESIYQRFIVVLLLYCVSYPNRFQEIQIWLEVTLSPV